MSTLILCTSMYEFTRFRFAGESFDSVNDSKTIATLQGNGGLLVSDQNGAVKAAAALASTIHTKQAGRPELCTALLMAAVGDQGVNLPKGVNIAAGATAKPDLTSGKRFVLPAATLAANQVLTLVAPGDAALVSGLFPLYQGTRREFTRLDAGAFTWAFLNGGPAAGTLTTLIASKPGFSVVEWNGTDWELVSGSAT